MSRDSVDEAQESHGQPKLTNLTEMQFWIDHPSFDEDSLGPSDLERLRADETHCRSLLEGSAIAPQEVLGSGAFGIVFRAPDVTLNRDIAIKILRPSLQLSPQALNRFTLEAKALARCNLENVVPVFDSGELGGLPYITTQYIAGPNLAVYLEQLGGPMDEQQAAGIMREVSAAVHGVHQRGILHRDLKPSNILLERRSESTIWNFPYRTYVSDFGLVKEFSLGGEVGPTDHSVAGHVVGTVRYMSPEQASGEPWRISVTSDIFSLGIILYEMLTCAHPFPGNSKLEVLRQLATAEPLPPRAINPKISRVMEAIVLKCLEKSPKSRYGTAIGLADDLVCFLESRPTAAQPVGLVGSAALWANRNRALATMATMLWLGMLITTVAIWQLYRRQVLLTEKAEQATDNALLAEDASKHVSQLAVGVAREFLQRVAEEKGQQPGQTSKRLELHEKGLKFFRELAEIRNHDAYSRHQLSIACHYVATSLLRMDRNQESIERRRESVSLLEALTIEEPVNLEYRYDLFYNRLNLAHHLPVNDRIEMWSLASEDISHLCRIEPENTSYLNSQNAIHATLADGYFDLGEYEKSMKLAQQTVTNSLVLAARVPDHPDYAKNACSGHRTLGKLLGMRHDAQAMHLHFQEALKILNEIGPYFANEGSWKVDELNLRQTYIEQLNENSIRESLSQEVNACLTVLDKVDEWYGKEPSRILNQAWLQALLARSYAEAGERDLAIAEVANARQTRQLVNESSQFKTQVEKFDSIVLATLKTLELAP